jgi:hypothetical protein
MSWKKKNKVKAGDERISALEANMSKMAESLNKLSEFVMRAPIASSPAQEAPIAQEQLKSDPEPQNTVKTQPEPGYEPGKQVAKHFAPPVAPIPVHSRPRVIAKLDAVQNVGPISNAHMSKAVDMMQKMDELKMGGQGMTVSDKVLFHDRSGSRRK